VPTVPENQQGQFSKYRVNSRFRTRLRRVGTIGTIAYFLSNLPKLVRPIIHIVMTREFPLHIVMTRGKSSRSVMVTWSHCDDLITL
jgi:hypothetical protein